jgi:hypothetical protein
VVSHFPLLARVLTAVVAAVAVALVLVWALQRRLIYLPAAGPPPSAAVMLPGSQEVSFDTEDGLRLRGWFVPAARATRGATVLVFNGNAGNRAARAPLATALARAGTSVLLFDYRGYGGNPRPPVRDRAGRRRQSGPRLPAFPARRSSGVDRLLR